MSLNYERVQISMAPRQPGTHAQHVSNDTSIIEPQPLSSTARGGKMMQSIARRHDISVKISFIMRKYEKYLELKAGERAFLGINIAEATNRDKKINADEKRSRCVWDK